MTPQVMPAATPAATDCMAGNTSPSGNSRSMIRSPWRAAAQSDGFWLALVLALLSCLPVVAARFPQMSDYPAHLARYYVMLDGGRSADLARYYSFQWQWTGNVGVDLLIRPFAALFGLELGGRVITGLIPVLTGLGILAVEWALRRRIGIGSLLAFAFIWSPMMLIGLLNFALGQAAALWAFALWVALAGDGRPWRWRWALFLPIGVAVWLCHLSAWGILGVMVLGYEWSRRKHPATLFRPWPLALPFLFLVFGHGTAGSFSYGAYWWIYKQAIWLKAMRDTSYGLDYLGEVAVILAIGAAIAFRRIDGRLGWAALFLAVLSIVLPRHISGGDYVDYRMITASLMIGCLAIDWQPAQSGFSGGVGRAIVLVGAPALYLARLAVTTLSWQADSAETAHLLLALDHVPRGARVASAVLVPRERWGLDHFEHIGAYAVVRKDALVNSNFAVAHVHMLHLKVPYYIDPSHRLLLGKTDKVDLAHFAPATDPVAGAQYLWYVGSRWPDTMPPGAQVTWRGEHTFVARLVAVALPQASPAARLAAPLAKSGATH